MRILTPAAEIDFSVPLNCTDTVDPAIGATCTAGTSANAVLPGAFLEGRQTVNDTFRVRINDAGPDLIGGNADDKLFAQQASTFAERQGRSAMATVSGAPKGMAYWHP